MSSTTFYILLAAGAVVIAPLGWLIRSARTRGSLFGSAFTAVIVAVIAGTAASSWFDAQNVTGLLAALGLTSLYVGFLNPSGGGSPNFGWGDGGGSGCGSGDGGGCGGGD